MARALLHSLFLLAAAAPALSGCPGPRTDRAASERPSASETRPDQAAEHATMSTSTASPPGSSPPPGPLTLIAAPRGGAARLVLEQAAAFDLTLRNDGPQPQAAAALDGNLTTPVARVLDAAGKVLVEAGPAASLEKVVGNVGPIAPPPPLVRTYAPGESESMWINLWTLTAPLSPGAYSFEAAHHLPPGGSGVVRSNRVPFEIVPARAAACAGGYDSASRMASVLAWIAAPREGSARLLARLSGFGNHGEVQQGGTQLAEVPADARVAVSHVLSGTWMGWIAVAAGRRLELFRHNMSHPTWQSGPIPVELDEITLVPRFPDRERGLALAAGKSPRGPALVGVAAQEGGPAPSAWAVPIAAAPELAACWFGPQGPAVVLLADDDGTNARYTRIDVDERGAVVTAEHVVRTSPNRALAIAADLRPGAPPAFMALEGSRIAPDRLALIHLPIGGRPSVVPFAPAPGWPSVVEQGGPRPLAAAEVSLDVAPDGAAVVAVVDERGGLSGGRLDGTPLRSIRSPAEGRTSCPHVAAFPARINVAGFTEEGALAVGAL